MSGFLMREFSEKNPLISIIVPSYFSEKHIGECIESVQKQTYKNFELIIIDGISKDKTLSIIRKYKEKDSRIKVINNQKDDGPAQARSEGIKASSGEFIAFLDSDDLWKENKLEMQLNFMLKNNYKFSFTRYRKLYPGGYLSRASIGGHNSNTFNQYLRRRGIANSTVMIKRECFDNEVLNTVGKSHGEDTLWWLLVLRKGNIAYALQKDLCIYRIVQGSLSSKIMNNQFTVWHSYRNELGLNIFIASFSYFFYVMDVTKRRFIFFLKELILK